MKQKIYRYYSKKRPIGIGTYPNSAGEPTAIVNFEGRNRIEPWGFLAWGYLEYSAPLDARHADDYELKPSPENPDLKQKMHEQTQVVGKWEAARRLPANRRLTWWYPDFGDFVVKEFVTPERLEELFNFIIEKQEES
jgi:hypothetical protein